jgi:hypothetical protein
MARRDDRLMPAAGSGIPRMAGSRNKPAELGLY